MAYMRLGDLLKAAGLIDEEQLQKALEIQKSTKQRLGTVLIDSGFITEQQFIDAMATQLGISFIDLTKTTIPTDMARILPKNIAKKHSVVPVRVVKDELVLAMVDPMNFVALEEVRTATRKRISPRIAQSTAVDRAIATLYGNEGAARAIEDMRSEGGTSVVQIVNEAQEIVDDSSANAAPTVRLVNSIIERGVTERASDIHMEPRAGDMVVRMRIDGVLRQILTVPRDLMGSVISRIKVMSNLDLTEKRAPQDGRANVRVRGTEIDLRISTLPTIYGEKITIRILNKSAQLKSADSLGMMGEDLEKYNLLMNNSDGMVIIVGPTGSGKSSTMYTMIGSLNTPEVNLVTLEDPVEYNIDGVNQVQINDKVGMTFAGGLRSILRQDPDIIAVGEIRDGETAEIALRAAITGHLVLSTLHTNSAISLLDRLLDIGCEPYLIAEALKGVISQRLVRRICPDCKTEYEAEEEDLIRMGLPADSKGVKIYKGKGCPNCFHTGYHGRIAVFEILVMSRRTKRMVAENVPRAELMEEFVREGHYRSLKDGARDLVLRGITTVSVMTRILNAVETD